MSEDRSTLYARQLAALIREETVSQNGPFPAFHALLRQEFPRLFALLEAEDFDGSLLLRWPGRDSAGEPALFMSHHDVVSAEEGWRHPPFSGQVADGQLWGRGTLDTKGNLWAMLRGAEELAGAGFTPARDIYFVTTCNEETSGAGADAISRALEARGVRLSLVLDEGGMVVDRLLPGVSQPLAMIGVGEKECVDLKFTARSRGGHASAPGRDTPLVRLGRFMARAETAPLFPARLSPAARELFRRLGGAMGGPAGWALAHPGLSAPLLLRLLPKALPEAAALTRTTLAFTQCQGSQAVNVLPEEAWVMGNMRCSHHQGTRDSLRAVTALAARYDIETRVVQEGFPSPLTDCRGPAFRLVERAAAHIFPDARPIPYVMTAASDSRFFSRVCSQCIRFAPIRITREQLDTIHGTDERVDLSALAPAVDFYQWIFREV